MSGLGSPLRLNRERIHIQAHIVIGSIHFLVGFGAEFLSPHHKEAHNLADCFFKTTREEGLLARWALQSIAHNHVHIITYSLSLSIHSVG